MWNLTGNQAPHPRHESKGASVTELPTSTSSLFHNLWGLGYDEGELGWLRQSAVRRNRSRYFLPGEGRLHRPCNQRVPEL